MLYLIKILENNRISYQKFNLNLKQGGTVKNFE